MSVDLTVPLEGRLIGDVELMARAGYKKSMFYRLKARGQFDFLLARPQVGKASKYCGTLVHLWVDGRARQAQPKISESPRVSLRVVNGR